VKNSVPATCLCRCNREIGIFSLLTEVTVSYVTNVVLPSSVRGKTFFHFSPTKALLPLRFRNSLLLPYRAELSVARSITDNSVALVLERTNRLSDLYLSAKLVPTFADKGVLRSQRSESPTAVILIF
jgi:hypothetical protein